MIINKHLVMQSTHEIAKVTNRQHTGTIRKDGKPYNAHTKKIVITETRNRLTTEEVSPWNCQ